MPVVRIYVDKDVWGKKITKS